MIIRPCTLGGKCLKQGEYIQGVTDNLLRIFFSIPSASARSRASIIRANTQQAGRWFSVPAGHPLAGRQGDLVAASASKSRCLRFKLYKCPKARLYNTFSYTSAGPGLAVFFYFLKTVNFRLPCINSVPVFPPSFPISADKPCLCVAAQSIISRSVFAFGGSFCFRFLSGIQSRLIQ